MDETDFVILKKLMANSRISYRELAEEINLTPTAVHKRVQKLVEIETIEAFIARPNVIALKGIWVGTWGTTRAKSAHDAMEKLREHESVYFIAILSGKFLHIGACLRDISELHNYSTFVAKAGQFDNPTIGIINAPYQVAPESLKKIDYRILRALNRDARKSIVDLVEELSISAKTIKKSLERMKKYQLANFTVEFAPNSENDFAAAFYITLHENTDVHSVLENLTKKFGKNLFYIRTYSNLPHYITVHTWTKTALETENIEKELQQENFKDVVLRIILSGYYFDCWLDNILCMK